VQMMRMLATPHHELQAAYLAGRLHLMQSALQEAWDAVRESCATVRLAFQAGMLSPAGSAEKPWGQWDSMAQLMDHVNTHVLGALAQVRHNRWPALFSFSQCLLANELKPQYDVAFCCVFHLQSGGAPSTSIKGSFKVSVP
jgi:hypothetical protein